MSGFNIQMRGSVPFVFGLDGKDHRKEAGQISDPKQSMQARSVACLTFKSELTKTGGGHSFAPHVQSLGARFHLAGGQSFAEQPSLSGGSAFLVGDGRYVLTAGHCLFNPNTNQRIDEKDIRLVFDYTTTHDGSARREFTDSVYKVKRVVGFEYNPDQQVGGMDWALLKLKRKPVGRTPLEIDFKKKPKEGRSVYMLGHPSGLPMKITDGAAIQWRSTAPHLTKDCFPTNLNAFRGNSGSPVFDSTTKKVRGILVSGACDPRTLDDYSIKKDGTRKVYKTSASTNCQSVRSLFVVQRFLQANGALGNLKGKELGKVQALVSKWISNGKYGLQKDAVFGRELLKKAANNGAKHAARELAEGYKRNGKIGRAFDYYLLGAKAGCKDAQYKVGKWLFYGNGKDVKENEERGLKWLRRSALKDQIGAKQLLDRFDPNWKGDSPNSKPPEDQTSSWSPLTPCYWFEKALSRIGIQ